MYDSVSFNNASTNGGSVSRVGRSQFPNPWCDYASTEMPRTLTEVLDWSEFLWLNDHTLRRACERVVRYFITQLEVSNVSDDEAEKYADFLEGTLNIKQQLALAGDDFMCYGNAFISLHIPFDRYLTCESCRFEQRSVHVNYDFDSTTLAFRGTCGKCGHRGTFKRQDRRSADISKYKLIRWPPKRIKIVANEVTLESEYYLRIPESLKRSVSKGSKFHINTTPWELLEAIRDDALFKFNNERLYHMKEETLAGLHVLGWGVPHILSSFKHAYYIQVLKRYNEAMAIDYIVPLRVITPVQGNSANMDPIKHVNLGYAKGQVMDMLAEHRRDPATHHFVPFPLKYESFGGEGMQMVTHELINSATDELLNARGVPAELYRGSLSVQAAPTALRLFQGTHTHLVAHLNRLLTWVARQVGRVRNWEIPTVRLQPPTMADDIEKKQLLLQLAAGDQVSKQTAFAPLGVDVREEMRRKYEERADASEQEREFAREEEERQTMESQLSATEQGAMAPGGMPPGGMAPPMPGGAPAGPAATGGMTGGVSSPQEMMVQAEQIAMQLLQMPYEQRKSQMLDLKHSNETLHALVKSKMEEQRQQAQQQGGMMLMQGGPQQ